MTGPRVEPEVERRARIQRETATIQAAITEGRLPPEAMQRYVERERITPEMEAARTPLTAGEKVAGGIRAGYQGASFNFGDELIGGIRGATNDFGASPGLTVSGAIDEERQGLNQFRAAHPKTALGLELAGGLATGLGAAKAVGAAAPGANLARTLLTTGAGSGAVAGYGSGEGAPLSSSRLVRGTVGAGLGAALGAVAPKVLTTQGGLAGPGGQVTDDLLSRISAPVATAGGRTGLATVQPSGMPTSPEGYGDPAFRAAGRAIPDRGKARTLLDQLEAQGMGDEALAMNVGDDQTVRAVRAAANQPGSTAGQTVNERLARQGGALGEAVPRDIGTVTGMGGTPGPIRLDQMQRDLSAKVGEGYKAFRELPDVPLDPSDEAQRLFIERYVNPVIETRRLSGRLTGASALSGENVDAAFKNLQREIRGAQSGVSMGSRNVAEAQHLEALRDRVLSAISDVDPNYAQLARTYALDEDVGKVVQEAFDTGLGLPGKPVGTGTVELGKTTPAGQEAMRAGFATNLQQRAGARASNADLGDLAQFRDVARAVVGTPQDRERFVEMFGPEKYQAMVDRLMPKIRAAAQNAAARGNSTTTKQLLDALAFGDDAMIDAVGQLATGSPQGALRTVASKAFSPMDRAYRLGVGKTAGETADLLTTKGAPKIRSLLDYLDQMGTDEAARKAAVQPLTGALARTAVSGGSRP